MYVVTGTTAKGETFVLGCTHSAKKAQAFADRQDPNQYQYVDVHYTTVI